MHYDVIGDVHGNVDKLGGLLRKLGYACPNGIWGHPDRTAVFLGDFIDRGPSEVATYRLVRGMIDEGKALAVMGNHELNAIAYHTPNGKGGHFRQHTCKNRAQHKAFLDEVEHDPELWREIIDWFLELPLWLDLPEIRVVHACWHDGLMNDVNPLLSHGMKLPLELIGPATTGADNSYLSDGTLRPNCFVFRAAETLLKGVEIDLPEGTIFSDKDGHSRSSVRMQWWNSKPGTFLELGLMPSDQRSLLPPVPVPEGVLTGYASDKPLFLGHYWMTGKPRLLASNVACVDYSAGKDGPLVAYRWSGEQTLSADNFVQSYAS